MVGNEHRDPNVLAVVESHWQREQRGLAKYGVDTTRSDLTDLQWVQHLQEELMDAAVYCERLKSHSRFRPLESTIQAFLVAQGGSMVGESVEAVVRAFVEFCEHSG